MLNLFKTTITAKKFQLLPDYVTMQTVELDSNGNITRIVFRTPEEIERLAKLCSDRYVGVIKND